MGRKDANVEKRIVRLNANLLPRDLNPSPSEVRRFSLNNELQYVYSLLAGKYGEDVYTLQVTPYGVLKVADVGSGFSRNEVFSGTAPDVYGEPLKFTEIVTRLDIFVWEYPVIYQRSFDGTIFDDEIEQTPNTVYSFDAITMSIKFRNKTAGQAGKFQVIGWR